MLTTEGRNNMIILITGGSGSGKSEYAENYTVSLGTNRIYIATMYSFDEESKKRIKRHQKMRRDKAFETIECYTNLEQLTFNSKETVILECMSNLVANEMYQENGGKENTVEAVIKGINHIKGTVQNLIIVTNEVFSDGTTYDEETTRYLSYLGEINRQIGGMADQVIEVVYTIPIIQKG